MILIAIVGVLFALDFQARASPLSLSISSAVELSWSTTTGRTYQVQWSPTPGAGPWSNLSTGVTGDGLSHTLVDSVPSGTRIYQVLETIPGTPGGPITINSLANPGFESGTTTSATSWTGTSMHSRSSTAHSGSYSLRTLLSTGGMGGQLSQQVTSTAGTIVAGRSYNLSFWIRQVSTSSSLVQQYQLQWLNSGGALVGATGWQNYTGTLNSWAKIAPASLVAPTGAVGANMLFYAATGAVAGAMGEVLLDDVALESLGGTAPDGPATVNTLAVANQSVASISWPTINGMQYQPKSTTDLSAGIWSNLSAAVVGNGGTKSIQVPIARTKEFIRVEYPVEVLLPATNLRTVATGIANNIGLAWDASPTLAVVGYRVRYGTSAGALTQTLEVGMVTTATLTGLVPGQTYFFEVVALTNDGQNPVASTSISAQPDLDAGILALFSAATALEPATTVETSTARITYLADRARDRHARESSFAKYDHYLTWYWEQRVANIEIIDRVAKGGTDITFNFTTQNLLNPAEFRAFFRGITTSAEYHYNVIAAFVSSSPSATAGETDFKYTATVSSNPKENNRALQIGDRVEIEISLFLTNPRNGRNNYYGTAMLYIVGQGVVPWSGAGSNLDSFPLPQSGWLGGLTTLPYQYSNEPLHRFKQMAGNIAPIDGQAFMSGRRLHHTDFKTGAHSEAGNPIFAEQLGKLGQKFVAQSCVDCHINNGRSLPPAEGAPLRTSVVRVGSDAQGTPHAILGDEIQTFSQTGSPEADVLLAGYTITQGTYGDGTAYTLRKPNYTFQTVTPNFYSVRVAPQLVGLGLLEAVSESTVSALADPNDGNHDGISGRMSVVEDPENSTISRLGRFTYKATQARVAHQIAYALNRDMSIPTSLFPKLDGETVASTPRISATELDQMNRYVALLGIGARRDLADSQALLGEQLFQVASCVSCHTATLTTSAYHPSAELRNQTIHPYTDLLVHDMGTGLADNMGEDSITGAEWRTSPLWSIGLTAGVSGGEAYLHDGRARTLEEAILWHGGEAQQSKEAFRTMSASDRAALIKFLKSL